MSNRLFYTLGEGIRRHLPSEFALKPWKPAKLCFYIVPKYIIVNVVWFRLVRGLRRLRKKVLIWTIGRKGDMIEDSEESDDDDESDFSDSSEDSDTLEQREEDYDSPIGPHYMYRQKIPDPLHGKHIRLLTLLPGEHSDDIRCLLTMYALESCPKYEALSYTWGSTENSPSIEVDGGILKVTRKLRSALRHLRLSDRSRLFWVDAVCINQEDLDERKNQVSIMRDIYRNAVRTVIWLGPASNDSDKAFLGISRLLAEQRASTKADFSERDFVTVRGEKMVFDLSAEDGHLDVDENSALGDLVGRSWFERVWVVQEVGVAADAIVVCGWTEQSWDSFSQAIQYGLEKDRVTMNILGAFTIDEFGNFEAIATIKGRDTTRPPAEQLLDLLIQFRTRDASNPIDKVYSLLGLVENVDDLELRPDYQLSVAEAYKLTAVAIMTHSQTLDILGACQVKEVGNVVSGFLPSWVPDWRSEEDTGVKPFRKDAKGQAFVRSASGKSKASPNLFEEGSEAILVLFGHKFDTITEVSDIYLNSLDDWRDDLDDDEFDYDSDSSFFLLNYLNFFLTGMKLIRGVASQLFSVVDYFEMLLRWEKLAKVGDPNGIVSTPTNEDHLGVYWQTICAGYMPDGYAETERQFKEWYDSMKFTRRLVRLRINAFPSIFQPLSFVGYTYSTWRRYSEFNELMAHCKERRLARTQEGYLCLVPPLAKKGDAIMLCKGGKIPLVLRSLSDQSWAFLGESYVHGLMDGEKFDEGLCQEINIK